MKNVYRNPRLVLAIALAMVLGAESAGAYKLFSPARKWRVPPTYRVDNRGLAGVTDSDGGVTRTINAITSAQAWNGAGCGTVVNAQAGSMSGFRLGDGIPMINFRDPTGCCTDNCLATTFTGYYYYDSYLLRYWIYDADIVTNSTGRYMFTSLGEDPDQGGCVQEYYVEEVMVHEVGHGLGLDHVDDPSATMYRKEEIVCDLIKTSIEADDRGGLRATKPYPVVDQQCNADCEAYNNDVCIGPYGGQDPTILQQCDVQLEYCRDWCMCY
ncbi:MAG TPA: matrixin family metalloprotease [Thermoanaerobaculia bacterium]|jgi:hypothetical protein|nr:matrixin family metalloprotease [Thermoanaerobaculia bacterium]